MEELPYTVQSSLVMSSRLPGGRGMPLRLQDTYTDKCACGLS